LVPSSIKGSASAMSSIIQYYCLNGRNQTLGNNCEPALFDTLRDAIEHWYQLIAAA